MIPRRAKPKVRPAPQPVARIGPVLPRRKTYRGEQMRSSRLRDAYDRILGDLDRPMIGLLLTLFLISCFSLYSASHQDLGRFWAHLRNLALASVLAVTLAQFSISQFQRVVFPLYALGIVLLLGVELFGETSKGATRWLNLGIARIQPSELMKIAMPLTLALIIHRREGQLSLRDWAVCALLLFLPFLLILRQPDLGTAILVGAAGFYVLMIGGLPLRLLAAMAALVLVPVLVLVIWGDTLCADGLSWPGLREYQRQRICTLLDPSRDPLGKGFHILQSIIAVGSGGFFGKGWMDGTQTQLSFIPERDTDFIFSGYAEEFGFLGAAVLVMLYMGIVLRALWVALGAPTIFGRLVAGSLGLVLFTYAFVNLGMVTGILPVVGVPLPFMSYGGSANVTLGVGLGLIFAVARDRSRLTQGFSFQG